MVIEKRPQFYYNERAILFPAEQVKKRMLADLRNDR